ncbi:hypothetical protein F503_08873 [Ophiostoma piceae UAMH 11346]|uniref:Uncharacterized protein n=1 Tax=Ophiostoma piceae (strain UAMH 11346) TaxID=1262450 RepID=S3BU77_OPHP1|nr:hypothetical protein F503_08873 [Ophiostoma piceae UAMH 11346]
MASPRRYGRIPVTSSDIIDYYFDSLSSQLGSAVPAGNEQTRRTEDNFDKCSRSSSFYSTDTPKEDTSTPRPEASMPGNSDGMSLREAFRNLCQVSLHIGNLRHARNTAHRELEEADERADDLARELVLERLSSTDQIDSSNQAISQITGILVASDGHGRSGDSQDTPSDPYANILRDTVRHTKHLKSKFHDYRRRLETEQRVLLWPALEQWRRAVEHFRMTGQEVPAGEPDRNSGLSRRAPPSIITISSLDDVDRIVRDIETVLPQLGRRRLEHLLERITTALQENYPKAEGAYVPTFI